MNWSNAEYTFISKQLRNLTRGYDQHLVDDFIQEVVLTFFEHPLKDRLLESGDWKFYMIRMGMNMFHSKTSKFHKKYRPKFTPFSDHIEVIDEVYDMEYDLLVESVLMALDEMLKSDVTNHRYLAIIILLYYSTGETFVGLSKLLETDRSNLGKNFRKGIEILKEYIFKNPSSDIDENLSKKLLSNKILKDVFMKKTNKKDLYEKWIKNNRTLFYNSSQRTSETTAMIYEIYNYFYNSSEKPTGCGACIAEKYNHFKEKYFEI